MSGALSSLEKLLTLSNSMAHAAEAQEWEALARQGQERATLLGTMPTDLARHLLPAERAQAKQMLERCRELDARISSLVAERQKELRVLLREPALAP